MIIIPDKLRLPAEVERDELRKQLAEAHRQRDAYKRALGTTENELAAAKAEIERLREKIKCCFTCNQTK